VLTQTLLVALLAAPVAVVAADPPTRNCTQTAHVAARPRPREQNEFVLVEI